jgi:Fe2+ transport system protein FeoA
MNTATLLLLTAVPVGARAVVRTMDATDGATLRLKAMGLCVGREIVVVRQGNPLIVRVLGARVGLSDRIARHIEVELVSA